MTGRNGESSTFVDKAMKISDKSKLKIIKSFVHFSVRDYFLSNEIRIVGRQQALMDKFFGAQEKTESDKKYIVNAQKDDIITAYLSFVSCFFNT